MHIILLNETHLIPSTKFKFPNYHIYQNDRLTTNRKFDTGGTTILVRKNIVHQEFKIQTTSIDNTTINISINDQEARISAI